SGCRVVANTNCRQAGSDLVVFLKPLNLCCDVVLDLGGRARAVQQLCPACRLSRAVVFSSHKSVFSNAKQDPDSVITQREKTQRAVYVQFIDVTAPLLFVS